MTPTIRLAQETDANAITDIYAPIVANSHRSFEQAPPTDAEMAERIQGTLPTRPWLVCEHDGEILGYAYASPHNKRGAYQWSVDVSVYVAESWRRRGIASGLYESLCSVLDHQGYVNAYAIIVLPNPESVTFHESMGFERVGVYENVGFKDGKWRDVGHWAYRIQETSGAPTAPTSLEAIDPATLRSALETGVGSIDV